MQKTYYYTVLTKVYYLYLQKLADYATKYGKAEALNSEIKQLGMGHLRERREYFENEFNGDLRKLEKSVIDYHFSFMELRVGLDCILKLVQSDIGESDKEDLKLFFSFLNHAKFRYWFLEEINEVVAQMENGIESSLPALFTDEFLLLGGDGEQFIIRPISIGEYLKKFGLKYSIKYWLGVDTKYESGSS